MLFAWPTYRQDIACWTRVTRFSGVIPSPGEQHVPKVLLVVAHPQTPVKSVITVPTEEVHIWPATNQDSLNPTIVKVVS